MSYQIRLAEFSDLSRILEIYEEARQFMKATGNPSQWGDHHPAENILLDDISRRQLYVCIEKDAILCVFAYIPGPDPTYAVIESGQWLNDEPYGVIHRMAAAQHGRGIAAFCFDWAMAQCSNLRIDTHRENRPMQSALIKYGCTRCGTIYLANGDPRIAFHKVK